ncbi:MAG: cytochrome c3 family protein [Blastocatellia bacterium]
MRNITAYRRNVKLCIIALVCIFSTTGAARRAEWGAIQFVAGQSKFSILHFQFSIFRQENQHSFRLEMKNGKWRMENGRRLRPVSGDDQCLRCHSTSAGRAAEVVRLHLASTHGKAAIACTDCHGGDSNQSDKAKAHAQNFIAKPDANGTLAMCGACHQTELAQFKSSRHFQSSRNQARLDCAECHGTHSVGNPPESFSYAQFCAGCHGLEYLPELPKEFQALLTIVDEVRDEFTVMAAKGRKPSDEAIKQRKELRRLTAELVHSTERADRAGGIERIPRILTHGERLKQMIKQH